MKSLVLSLSALLAVAAPAQAQRTPVPNERGDSAGNSTLMQPPETGEAVYRQVCQACHMADGKGGTGAGTIPALANNPRLGAAAYPVLLIARGRGAMPGLTDLLDPAQIASVSTYVRTHFGNSFTKPVTVDDVTPYLPQKK
jgi:mono/diheme cytochrome c family protein